MNRGDIWMANLEPVAGREIRGMRPCLLVSKRRFNQMGVQLVCPITSGGVMARNEGWAVSLSGAGTQTQGVVLVNQMRMIDMMARRGRKIEQAPDFITDEVLARIAVLIE